MRLGILLVVLSLALASPAIAQPRKPTGVAARLLDRGRRAYDAGRLDEAIAAWRDGLRKQPLPVFHWHLGRAYKEKGDLDAAAASLRTYLEVAPEPPGRGLPSRADAEALLATVERDRRVRDVPAPAPAPVPAPVPVAPPAAAPPPPPITPGPGPAPALPPAAVEDDATARGHGFLIGVDLGYGQGSQSPAGGFLQGWTSNASGGVALGLSLFGRPWRYAAIGGSVGYARLSVENTFQNTTSNLGGYWVAVMPLGLQVFPLGGRLPFDPWGRFAIGYGMWASEGEIGMGGPTGTFRLHGVAFEAAVGLPFYLGRTLAVGPVLRIFPMYWIQECLTGAPTLPNCESLSELPSNVRTSFEATLPALWMLGVEAQIHL